MLNRYALATLLCASFSVATYGQAQDSEPQLLRNILAELRAIHQDMQVTETTQLLVAELQMQQGVVNRATETADNAHEKLNQIHFDQLHTTSDMGRAQDQFDKSSSAGEREGLTREIERAKSNIADLKIAERDQNAAVQDADQRLQAAKDKLEGIEAELSAAISHLSPMTKDSGTK